MSLTSVFNPNTAQGQAWSAAASTAGQMAGNFIGDGYSSTAGDVTSGLASVVSTIPGPIGAIGGAGLGVVGGFLNRMFGAKLNKENIARVNSNIQALNSFSSNAGTWDALQANMQSMPAAMSFTDDFIGKNGWFNHTATDKARQLRLDMGNASSWANRQIQNNAQGISYNMFRNSFRNSSAFGGPLQSYGADWSNKLVDIQSGGTHEQNPYQGVQVGVDGSGIPNLVEQGELVWDGNYVFSNRLRVPQSIIKQYKLGGSTDQTFAEAVRKLQSESEERPNDPISKNYLQKMVTIMQEQQELAKAIHDMQEQQAQEQQAMMQNALYQQAMANGYACGGRLFQGGGKKLAIQENSDMPYAEWDLQSVINRSQQIPQTQTTPQGYMTGFGNFQDYTTSLGNLTPGALNSRWVTKEDVLKFIDKYIKEYLTNEFPGSEYVSPRSSARDVKRAAFNQMVTKMIKGKLLDRSLMPSYSDYEAYKEKVGDSKATNFQAGVKKSKNNEVVTTQGTFVDTQHNDAEAQSPAVQQTLRNKYLGEAPIVTDTMDAASINAALSGLISERDGSSTKTTRRAATASKATTKPFNYDDSKDRQIITENAPASEFEVPAAASAAMDSAYYIPDWEFIGNPNKRYEPTIADFQKGLFATGGNLHAVVGNLNTPTWQDYAKLMYGYKPIHNAQGIPVNSLGNQILNYQDLDVGNARATAFGWNKFNETVPNKYKYSSISGNKSSDYQFNPEKYAAYHTAAGIPVNALGQPIMPVANQDLAGVRNQTYNWRTEYDNKYAWLPYNQQPDWYRKLNSVDVNSLKIERPQAESTLAKLMAPGAAAAAGLENTASDRLSPWENLRYAPAIGAGLGVFTDLLGLTNQPDYTIANELSDATRYNNKEVRFDPVGNYLSYTPYDINMVGNLAMQNAARASKAAYNNGFLNRATANIQDMINTKNLIEGLGSNYVTGMQYNDSRNADVVKHNASIDQYNSTGSMSAQTANQKNMQERLAYANLIAQMKDAERRQADYNRNLNLTNFFNSLGDIGREIYAMNQIRKDKSILYDDSGYKNFLNYMRAYGMVPQ